MEDPVQEIGPVVHKLTQGSPIEQKEALETYFTEDAAFYHPFCRVDSARGSREWILCILRWYKIMSPKIDLEIQSIGRLPSQRGRVVARCMLTQPLSSLRRGQADSLRHHPSGLRDMVPVRPSQCRRRPDDQAPTREEGGQEVLHQVPERLVPDGSVRQILHPAARHRRLSRLPLAILRHPGLRLSRLRLRLLHPCNAVVDRSRRTRQSQASRTEVRRRALGRSEIEVVRRLQSHCQLFGSDG